MYKLTFALLLCWFLLWAGIVASSYLFAAPKDTIYPALDSKYKNYYLTDEKEREYICDFRQSKTVSYTNYPFTYLWCTGITITPTPTLSNEYYYSSSEHP